MDKIVKYFSNKHLFTNFIVIGVFIGAVIFWFRTGKEELPNITFDFVRVSAQYPGATAEEVEYFVTKEIEDALEGIDGIESISSTSSQGSCSVSIELSPNMTNRDETLDEIKDAVDSLKLPDEVEDDPQVREFKTSKKAIIDLMIVLDDVDMLTFDQRIELQKHVDSISDRLISLPSISAVDSTAYLDEYIEIQVDPDKLIEYNISITEVISAIKKNNLKQPLGTLDDEKSTKLRLDAELYKIDDIKNIIIQSSFEGYHVRLNEIASVTNKFEDRSRILKANGNEAVRITVTKTASIGILKAIKEVKDLINNYSEKSLKNSNVKIIPMDDESMGIRNRLTLIAINGLIGFLLIIIILFIFLNAKSAFWVAMGIPFTFGFTIILSSLMGYTINNITLAGVVIVMGMIVDDAIVVAENVTRLIHDGVPVDEAVVKGTSYVLLPIVASILTTCVAFIPLFFFRGRFGLMVKFIPPIIFLMLGGSLFEAIFILPSHLKYKFPRWVRIIFSLGMIVVIENYYKKRNKPLNKQAKAHWFTAVEDGFGKILNRILKFKWLIYIVFAVLLIYSGFIFFNKMKFVMFPGEETTSLRVFGSTDADMLKFDTEKKVREVEEILLPYIGKEIVAFRTDIARSRWGGAAFENVFSIWIEIVPKEKRKKTSNELIAELQEKFDKLEGYEQLAFSKSRFGQDSGNSIDIVVKEHDDEIREAVSNDIVNYLKRIPSLENQEIETIVTNPEIKIDLKRDLINRLNISADSIASTLRTIVEGNNVYDISKTDKDMDVIVTISNKTKENIDNILDIPVQNNSNYLVPLKKIVNIHHGISPQNVNHLDKKRVIHVYSDLKNLKLKNVQNAKPNNKRISDKNNQNDNENIDMLDLPVKMTPLEIAKHLEENLFPELNTNYPSAEIEFEGEIKDSRESGQDFIYAIILVILLIYIILALTLNSFNKPLIIMLSIPFGCVGIILALQLHGMLTFGFFSVIGALGLAGVVVNDSIILLSKLEIEYPKLEGTGKPHEIIANITKTRLRAVLLTTVTTVAGLLPTAYGVAGYDSMLAEMMLTMSWGLMFGTLITLVLIPSLYCTMKEFVLFFRKERVK